MSTNNITLWAGDEQSFAELAELKKVQSQLTQPQASVAFSEDEEEQVPYLLEVSNGVALIHIKGGIDNSTAWYDRYIGRTTYPAIREALVYAASDDNIKQIVLNINSPGGAVNGIGDTVKLINTVSTIKPVISYTDGSMCSAAYWMGCAAGTVYCSDVSDVGSVGVIAVHKEFTKMYAEAGITPTVFRSGEFKALGNPSEELTDTARRVIQAQLDSVYKVFLGSVSTARQQPVDFVDKNMAQGKVFVGADALSARLVDGITTLDELMSRLEANNSLDSPSLAFQNSTNGIYTMNLQGAETMATTKTLTATQVAQIQAGVSVEANSELPKDEGVSTEAEVTDTQIKSEGTSEEAVDTPKAEATTEPVEETVKPSALLEAANDKIVDLRVELKAKDLQLAAHEGELQALTAIAVGATNTMKVALDQVPVEAEGMTAKLAVENYQTVETQFKKAFVVGGRAQVDATAEESQKSQGSPVNMAALRASGAIK